MQIVHTLGLAIPAASLIYLLTALWSLSRYRNATGAISGRQPPMTVIKPVRGLEPQLYENLRSFCEQDYPCFQVVFSVAREDDPALPVIRRLVAEHPHLDLSIVVSSQRCGSNNKISNVANAEHVAKHDLLVVADSDMRVGRDYLRSIAAAFEDPKVGAATCLYVGAAAGNLASRLGSMYINETFLPSVLVARHLEQLRYCFGATMAIRRNVLTAIGGFVRLGNFLADDYMLGKLVSEQGFRVVLAPVLVQNVVYERSLGDLLRHELRWARTVRTVRPAGYALSIFTQTVPLSAFGWLVCRTGSAGMVMLGGSLILRMVLHLVARSRLGVSGGPALLLVPLREMMNLSVWVGCFLGNSVEWRGSSFSVAGDGQMKSNEVVNS